ncbi:MAG: hypothetical protein AAF438_21340 [Pseudomonadota bacterium]
MTILMVEGMDLAGVVGVAARVTLVARLILMTEAGDMDLAGVAGVAVRYPHANWYSPQGEEPFALRLVIYCLLCSLFNSLNYYLPAMSG